MKIQVHHQDVFTAQEEGLILTVDGSARGMEGNIARRFAMQYPEDWEEINETLHYPIPLGNTQAIAVLGDEVIQHRHYFIASTLHHGHVLSDKQKLEIQASALRHALSLAEARQVKSIATTVMVGGWRLEFGQAFRQMLNTISRAQEISPSTPTVSIYIAKQTDYTTAKHIHYQHSEQAPQD